MKCPRDGAELRAQSYEADIRVDACADCGGMWLDEGELEKIQETNEHDYSDELARMPDLGYRAYELAQQKSRRTIHCPKCGAELEALEYARCSAILIDACPKCRGIWLDRGEIESLEVFFERARAQATDVRRGFFASLTSLFRD